MEPIQLATARDFAPLAPAIVVALTAMAVLVVDLIKGKSARPMLPFIAAGGLIVALATLNVFGRVADEPVFAFYNCLRFDAMTYIAHNAILGISIFLIFISPLYLQDRLIPNGEYYALMLFAAMGTMVLASSNELLTLFLNFELASFTLYILTGLEKENLRSTEAAFKYFLTGSYAAAFLLFGIALVFGAIGSTHFNDINAALSGAGGAPAPVAQHPLLLMAGFSLMLVGLGFKMTLAPFHMYAPDVYAGAPTPVAGAIATISKVGVIVAFFNLFRLIAAWAEMPPALYYIFYGITILSILIGNLGAVVQPNIKRLLAYSGVAHSGYVMIPVVAALTDRSLLPDAEHALTYYLIAYALMTVLAFGVAASLGPQGESHIDRYAGLARRSPFLAAVLALSMISLTGIPPTVGFVGKFYLFSVAVNAELYFLAIFGVLASVASAYYYLRVIVKMFMEEAPAAKAEPVQIESLNAVVLLAASAGVFLFAIFPALVFLL